MNNWIVKYRKLEPKLLFFVFILIILKFFNVIEASFLLVTLLTGGALFYFIGGFTIFSFNDEKNTSVGMITGFVSGLVIVGVLYKLMYWSGANKILFLSFFPLLILLIPYSYIKIKKVEQINFYKNILIRSICMLVIGFVFFSIPYKTMINIQYRDNQNFANALIKFLENPESNELAKKVEENRINLKK